ncbi:hypothetical protein FRB90_012297 [Tulasnella sp. 427]|nr:hypothetical protein FRB90_012297 [Tulasnella sp. 427]
MASLFNRLPSVRLQASRTLSNVPRVSAFHSSVAIRSNDKPTPKVYVQDTYKTANSGGITEEEGAGGKQPGVADEYVQAGVPESEKKYGAPGGPYQTGNPLETPHKAEKPTTGEPSSTSPEYAHPVLTKRASRVEDGVGSSSAVRHRDAPGQMSQGGYGGKNLSDGARPTENKLAERSAQPKAKVVDDVEQGSNKRK